MPARPDPSRASTLRLGPLALLCPVIVVVILAAGCRDDDAASAPTTPARASSAAPAPSTTVAPGCEADPDAIGGRSTHERVEVTSAGADRWYARYVPESYHGAPVPLVVDLHGYLSGSAGSIDSDDLRKAISAVGVGIAVIGTDDDAVTSFLVEVLSENLGRRNVYRVASSAAAEPRKRSRSWAAKSSQG